MSLRAEGTHYPKLNYISLYTRPSLVALATAMKELGNDPQYRYGSGLLPGDKDVAIAILGDGEPWIDLCERCEDIAFAKVFSRKLKNVPPAHQVQAHHWIAMIEERHPALAAATEERICICFSPAAPDSSPPDGCLGFVVWMARGFCALFGHRLRFSQ